jgi:hypothetical protein
MLPKIAFFHLISQDAINLWIWSKLRATDSIEKQAHLLLLTLTWEKTSLKRDQQPYRGPGSEIDCTVYFLWGNYHQLFLSVTQSTFFWNWISNLIFKIITAISATTPSASVNIQQQHNLNNNKSQQQHSNAKFLFQS